MKIFHIFICSFLLLNAFGTGDVKIDNGTYEAESETTRVVRVVSMLDGSVFLKFLWDTKIFVGVFFLLCSLIFAVFGPIGLGQQLMENWAEESEQNHVPGARCIRTCSNYMLFVVGICTWIIFISVTCGCYGHWYKTHYSVGNESDCCASCGCYRPKGRDNENADSSLPVAKVEQVDGMVDQKSAKENPESIPVASKEEVKPEVTPATTEEEDKCMNTKTSKAMDNETKPHKSSFSNFVMLGIFAFGATLLVVAAIGTVYYACKPSQESHNGAQHHVVVPLDLEEGARPGLYASKVPNQPQPNAYHNVQPNVQPNAQPNVPPHTTAKTAKDMGYINESV